MFYCCFFNYSCIFFRHAVLECLLVRHPTMGKIAAKRRKISVQKGFAADRSLVRLLFFSLSRLPANVQRNWNLYVRVFVSKAHDTYA